MDFSKQIAGLNLSDDEIAVRVGRNRETVNRWRNGLITPHKKQQAMILAMARGAVDEGVKTQSDLAAWQQDLQLNWDTSHKDDQCIIAGALKNAYPRFYKKILEGLRKNSVGGAGSKGKSGGGQEQQHAA